MVLKTAREETCHQVWQDSGIMSYSHSLALLAQPCYTCVWNNVMGRNLKNVISVVNNSLCVSLSQILKLSRRPLSSFSLTSSSSLHLINLWVPRCITESCCCSSFHYKIKSLLDLTILAFTLKMDNNLPLGKTKNNTLINSSEKWKTNIQQIRNRIKPSYIPTLEMLHWYINLSQTGAAALLCGPCWS